MPKLTFVEWVVVGLFIALLYSSLKDALLVSNYQGIVIALILLYFFYKEVYKKGL